MKNKAKIFTVLLGDLIRSKSIENRSGMSRKINFALRKVSKAFADDLIAPLQQTKGIDEFSGVLKNPSNSYRICRNLNDEVFPESFRFSIARGRLDVGTTTKDARRMDGEAFHLAAGNLKRLKKQSSFYIFDISEDFDKWLNQVANLTGFMASGWSKHQHKVFTLYETMENQEKIASKLKISQQAVSNVLKAINYKTIADSHELIDMFLEEYADTSK